MKWTRYMLLMPVLLAQALSSCSLIDEPEYDADNNGSVKASLAFLVSSAENGSTRMSDAVVQETGSDYRGIDILSMTPFAINVETFRNNGFKIVSTDVPKQQYADANRVDDEDITPTYYLYRNYDLDIGTNAFLVYGRALIDKPTKPSGVNDQAFYGSLKYEESKLTNLNLATLRFTLEPISPQIIPDEAGLLAGYLNHIAQASGWSATSDKTLQNLFLSFTGQRNEENMMLAGSSANVMAHVNALYDYLTNPDLSLTDAGETIKTAILNSITNYQKEGLTLTPQNGKLTDLKVNGGYFPASKGLPDGAAALRWAKKSESSSEYEFKPRIETTPLDNINNIGRFSYPAELFYYTNSRIDTSNSIVEEEYYKAETPDWVGYVLPQYENKSSIVTNSTKSVAIHEPLQYAVGRLKMTMIAETATGKLKDSKGDDVPLSYEENSEEKPSFPLTGIIICNQHPVDFNFKPVLDEYERASHDDDCFIYDTQVKIEKDNDTYEYCYLTADKESNIPSTLVLQTYDTGEGNDGKGAEDVNIVMEFLNNSGQTFYGKSCVIYPGTKFYLVGQVKPSEAILSSETPASKGRVFTQDHVTTVNTKVQSLAKAYNVLPDLIGGRLELGVELVSSWVQAETTNVILK